MTIRIAPCGPGDLSRMTDLWVEAWAQAYPAIDFSARRGWFAGRIADMAGAGTVVLLALRDDDLAGFVTVDPATGWIDQMLVGLAHQGTGAADALMAAARGLRPAGLSLDVNADNARAIAFYRRQGFATTGRRVNEQGRAVDLMAWRPPQPPAAPSPT